MTEYEEIKNTWEVKKIRIRKNLCLFSSIFIYTNEVNTIDEIKWKIKSALTDIAPKIPTISSYKGNPGGREGI